MRVYFGYKSEGVCDGLYNIMSRDDQPDYLLKLSNDDETCLSGVGLTNTEIERREEIARSKYYAVILINGQVGTTSTSTSTSSEPDPSSPFIDRYTWLIHLIRWYQGLTLGVWNGLVSP